MKKYKLNLGNKRFVFLSNARKIKLRPKKSIVHVYFPHRGKGWAYFNDRFDLHIGDIVYVDGKLNGYRGRVTEVNYSFKIKPSDYKKVIAVVDTSVIGDLYIVGSHFASFDKNTMPFSKVINWFKVPDNDDYIVGDDDTNDFTLDNLFEMGISQSSAEHGYDYYIENKVLFVEIDDTKGRAIVEGSDIYEIEFNYCDGRISNMKCSCYCCGACKHEYAAMLQLQETLEFISTTHQDKYDNYLSIISKEVLINTAIADKRSGTLHIEV